MRKTVLLLAFILLFTFCSCNKQIDTDEQLYAQACKAAYSIETAMDRFVTNVVIITPVSCEEKPGPGAGMTYEDIILADSVTDTSKVISEVTFVIDENICGQSEFETMVFRGSFENKEGERFGFGRNVYKEGRKYVCCYEDIYTLTEHKYYLPFIFLIPMDDFFDIHGINQAIYDGTTYKTHGYIDENVEDNIKSTEDFIEYVKSLYNEDNCKEGCRDSHFHIHLIKSDKKEEIIDKSDYYLKVKVLEKAFSDKIRGTYYLCKVTDTVKGEDVDEKIMICARDGELNRGETVSCALFEKSYRKYKNTVFDLYFLSSRNSVFRD